VGRGRGGTAFSHFFRQGGHVPHSPQFFGLKFVQTLVNCCNWLLTETQCKIVSVQHVCRPKLFKNFLSKSCFRRPPLLFLGLQPWITGRTEIVTKRKKKKPQHKVHLWLRFEWAKTAYFVWRKIDRQSSHSVRSHGASQQMMKHIADNLPLTIFPGCTILQALHTGENEAVALAPHAKHKATSRWPEQ